MKEDLIWLLVFILSVGLVVWSVGKIKKQQQQTQPAGGCIYIQTDQCFCHDVGDEGGTEG